MNIQKSFALLSVFLFAFPSSAEDLLEKVENLYSQLAELSTQIEELSTTTGQNAVTEAFLDDVASNEAENLSTIQNTEVSIKYENPSTKFAVSHDSAQGPEKISTTHVSETHETSTQAKGFSAQNSVDNVAVPEKESSIINEGFTEDPRSQTEDTTEERLREPEQLTSNVNDDGETFHIDHREGSESHSGHGQESNTVPPHRRQTTREKLSGNAMILGWGGICLVLGALFFAVFTLVGNHFAKKRDEQSRPIVVV
ncbi:uncharacterized protein LOC131886762 [Tigriopus californicus]|uniref:uncharacterized protein LOC131886762 n=1 Tax=Tigriopus californicus TaxID=6832 RepID=UPI0027D9F169|nr:uncharacterized protein LOC131886762 [Tigriopus californicus]|eukprot:TCALIF_02813-PA protein Name:"Protein of unknown function" AED:0.00 eAED:0.00 QI:88/1/1/1/1/1/2/218/254